MKKTILSAACLIGVVFMNAASAAAQGQFGSLTEEEYVNQQAAAQEAESAGTESVRAWHESLKNSPPQRQGCFRAYFPSPRWEEETCGPPPNYRSDPSITQTVGNGYDYSAKTSSLTRSAIGNFPSETGVTSASSGGYTLQLNTNISSSSPVCAAYGYSSCQTWEQFIYSSSYPGNAGTGVSGPQAFIQDWLFIPKGKRCPRSWNSYKTSSYNGCYRNSNGVAAPAVALTGLANAQLSGAASMSGNDTVTFSYNGVAHAVSQAGNTLDIGAVWNESEFNVVGNGGGSAATFNSGSHLTVKLAVTDGTSNTPGCIGPSNGGTTGETNNLNLGPCTATGGSAPYIQFTESN